MDMIISYKHKKDYLKDLNNKIKRKFYINRVDSSYRKFSLDSIFKLLSAICLLAIILTIYVAYFSKCYKNFENQANINNERYFNDFEFQTNQTNYWIRMPFCSYLYQDRFHFQNYTSKLGRIYNYFFGFFCFSELYLIVGLKFKILIKKIDKKCSCCSPIYFGGLLIAILFSSILIIPLFLLGLLFEALILYLSRGGSIFTKFSYEKFDQIIFLSSFQTQILSLYLIIKLKDRLKPFGLYGAFVIKHTKSLKKHY